MQDRPLVVVLLATHNGAAFLGEQLDSILAQRDVDVRIVVSDDGSTDATPALLAGYAADPRIELLPAGAYGSAHANFLRLIRDAPVEGAAAIAFSDQDDVWNDERLAKQLEQLETADAVSANVIAVFEDRRVLLDKAQPQRELDFVLESAGPGCTFVLSPAAFELVRHVVRTDPEAGAAPMHDWLVYAVVRAAGMRWHIDPAPVIDYRQHASNVTGANVGWRQARTRLQRMRSGGFRRQAAVVARIASRVAEGDARARLVALAALLERDDARARLTLLRGVGSLRRRASERVALAGMLLLGVW
ncbi:glycosyltransferase [Agrococcus citreus]|uniref:Glycosyltransferase family 2 protein n=1 Tax=Agrococcus citreus TaxID=84643 RepID=A0ABN1YYP0_9MICO